MKGTPEAPQCGFSRAVCQILDVQVSIVCDFTGKGFCYDQTIRPSDRLDPGWIWCKGADADVKGVPRESMKSFNCLEDQELRSGIKEYR
jgi:monothiol glutaredoxin